MIATRIFRPPCTIDGPSAATDNLVGHAASTQGDTDYGSLAVSDRALSSENLPAITASI